MIVATEIADERLQFAGIDADYDALHPVPVKFRSAIALTWQLRLREMAKGRLRLLAKGIAKDIAREESRGTPFLFAPVFLGTGAIFYFAASNEPSLLLLAAMALVLLTVWQYRLVAGHKAWLAAALCMVACGAMFAKIETISATTTMLGGEISTQADLRIRKLEIAEKAVRITADVLATSKPVLKYAPSRIKVTLRNAPAGLKAGDIISARFGLQPPSGPVRPGGYDFAFHSWFAGVGATGYSMGKITKLPENPAGWRDQIAFGLENTRMAIAAKVMAVIPGTDGAMAAALIAGVSGGIDEDTNEAMRLTGLAHIISISGLHMALVAGVFMVAIRLGFALFPAFASRLPVKKYGAAVALFASFLYLLLSGAGVATMRSFIMLAVMLIAVLFDRQALTLRNLAISAILILIVTPHEVMGPSFQMSFAATAALISAYSWISERQQEQTSYQTHSKWPRVKQFLVGATLTPIVAGLATALFSAWHFHRLSPMGLPANLAAMPAVSLIVMPFAVLSALAMPFGLEYWPLKIMGEGVHLMLDIARYFAKLSPAGLSGAISVYAYFITTFGLLLLCLLQTRLRLIGLAMLPIVLILLANPPSPDLLISENAKLVAYVAKDGRLFVNRTRPNGFTTQTWQRANRSTSIVKPGNDATAKTTEDLYRHAAANKGQFICNTNMCVLQTETGNRVAYVEQPAPQPDAPGEAGDNGIHEKRPSAINDNKLTTISPDFIVNVRQACTLSDLVIAATPTPFMKCPVGNATLLPASMFAKKGTAEINFPQQNRYIGADPDSFSEQKEEMAEASGGRPSKPQLLTEPTISAGESQPTKSKNRATLNVSIRFAVGDPVRPWNRERMYSRAARNIPDFQPPRKIKSIEEGQTPTATTPPPAKHRTAKPGSLQRTIRSADFGTFSTLNQPSRSR